MKSLFKNNVSIKDFFHNQRNQGKGRSDANTSDSAIDNSSQSQFPYSQIEFPDTQDYSQNAQLSHSQLSPAASQNQSPGRKYGSLFGGKNQLGSQKESRGGGGGSYQKQMQTHKAKAKERDERDVVNLMLSSMRECTADIQVAVDAVKKKVHDGIECTESSLTQTLHQIQHHLQDHTTCVKHALEVKNDVTQKIATLETTVSLKDSQIVSMQEEIRALKNKRDNNVVTELQKVYMECQENTTDNMQEMYNRHQHELGKLGKLNERHYKELSNKTQVFHEQLQQEQATTLRDLYDNLIGEINKSLDGVSRDLESDIVKKVQTVQQQYCQQVQKTILKQIDGMSKKDNHGDMSEVLKQQCELKELQEQQLKQLQTSLSQKIHEMSMQQQRHLTEATGKLWKDVLDRATKSDEQEKEKVQKDVETRYEQELIDLKERYQKEVAMLMADKADNPPPPPEEPAPTRCEVVPPKTFRPHLSCFSPKILINKEQKQSSAQPFNDFSLDIPLSTYDPTSRFGGPRKTYEREERQDKDTWDPFSEYDKSRKNAKAAPKQMGGSDKQSNQRAFVSPYLHNRDWTSKSLFAKKSNPSPVATVAPLGRTRKQTEKTTESAIVDIATQKKPDPKPAAKPTNKKRRKKAPKYTRKKKKTNSQANNSQATTASQNTQADGDTDSADEDDITQFVAPQSESIFGPSVSSKSDKGGIYDFHDDDMFKDPVESLRPTTSRKSVPSYQSLFKPTQPNKITPGNIGQATTSRMDTRNRRSNRSPFDQSNSSQDEYCSIDSSPSLSITEIVIKRKIKKEKNSPNSQNDGTPAVKEFRPNRYAWDSKALNTGGPFLLKRPVRGSNM